MRVDCVIDAIYSDYYILIHTRTVYTSVRVLASRVAHFSMQFHESDETQETGYLHGAQCYTYRRTDSYIINHFIAL